VALFLLQAVLFALVVFGLDQQLFAAGTGIVLPTAEQVVEQWRQAMQPAAQDFTLCHAAGQCFDQRRGIDQRLVVLLHAAHVAECLFRGGDIVDAAGAQAVLEGIEEQLLELRRGNLAHMQQVDEQCAEGLQALFAGRAQRDQCQVQRYAGMPADQQSAQLLGLDFISLEAVLLKVGEQFALAQAGTVFLVVGQIQCALVGEELVAKAPPGTATGYADDMRAVGQGDFHEDVAGVCGKVELARLLQAVLAEAHVRHAGQDGELQGVDRSRLAQVIRAVHRQRVLQWEDPQAVAGGIQQGKTANAIAFLAHCKSS